jgi:hypothetical protein
MIGMNRRKLCVLLIILSLISVFRVTSAISNVDPTVVFQTTGLENTVVMNTTLTVDGVSYTGVELPIVFNWTVGSNHNFTWAIAVDDVANVWWKWNSTSGLATIREGNLTVTTDGVVTACYTQVNPQPNWIHDLFFSDLKWIFLLVTLLLVGILVSAWKFWGCWVGFFVAMMLATVYYNYSGTNLDVIVYVYTATGLLLLVEGMMEAWKKK